MSDLAFSDVAVGARMSALVHDVTATSVVLGALASRDVRPMHHDRDFAQVRNGVRDIFMNTPNQAAWFERFLTDWSGPRGRIGRITFRMLESVFPGDTMTLSGEVTKTWTDVAGCAWVEVAMELKVDERVRTRAAAVVAVANGLHDNPWGRHGDEWRPTGASE